MNRFIEFMDLEIKGLRKKLIENNFYENITFESEELEKVISEWIIHMKVYKKLELIRFTQLLEIWEEIKIPVILTKEIITQGIIQFTIIDNEGKEFYMEFENGLLDFNNYFLGRRDIVDREFGYNIETSEIISMNSSYIGLLNQDGSNGDGLVSIYYDSKKQMATAKIQKEERIVEIKYQTEDTSKDNEVMNYLLSIIDKDYSENVVPIAIKIIELLGKVEDLLFVECRIKVKKDEVHIKEIVSSKVCVEDRIIFDYTPRKIII